MEKIIFTDRYIKRWYDCLDAIKRLDFDVTLKTSIFVDGDIGIEFFMVASKFRIPYIIMEKKENGEIVKVKEFSFLTDNMRGPLSCNYDSIELFKLDIKESLDVLNAKVKEECEDEYIFVIE